MSSLKTALIAVTAALALAATTACRNGHETATGTPYTDITNTSTESGAYAHGSPYSVINETRNGQQLVLDVNIRDMGRADDIGRRVVNEKKGDATTVTVHVYPADRKPPAAPDRTIQWSEARGFTES